MTTYRVDLGAVGSALGSKDGALLASLKKKFATRIADLDDALAEEGEESSAVAKALGRLIDDGAEQLRSGPAAGYALELIVDNYGTFLANNAWYPCAVERLEQIDALLRASGVELSLIETFFCGTPWSMPQEIEFLPAIGHLQALAAGNMLAHLKGETVINASPSTAAGLGQFRAWLVEASKRRQGLIFFYY